MPVFPNNISLRQLRAFAEVARHGAFAPAARELCLTQSALSESIRQLEEALGLRLFDRTTRTVGLTAAGQAFLLDVRQAFETLEQGFQNLGDLAALRRGKVRIAAAPSVLAVLLLPVLPALRVRHPGIEVDLIEDSAEGIAQRVQAGSVDFGVGAAHPAGGDLLTQPLISDAMGLVARLDEPLLQAGRLTAADLADLAFVGLTTDTAISQLLASEPGMPQNLLQTPLRLSNPQLLFEAVSLGLGVSIVPALTARHPSLGLQGNLGFRLLDEPRILRRTLLIQRPRRALSPAAQLLFDALAAQVRTLAQFEGITPD
ncbi:LysR family transcriptional regulator [Comamonas testosteroni]|uniref:HTH-type transcriptional activator CmpR n=1 Tax=Comamonas testosteroni TaxID=285 RepID=A0A8B4S4H1_COMTE|nr:LysR family transcriptional regulator [Comamonas testosteroni]EHN65530.1 LysR family transcriptional regulator [Comamonas testosteroni ATCC 11996]QQN68032.1 LysR family transcriptional regulator [Comamonas testosteroni]SUY78747.1 HTH-type transcriptional activator CmpR [Comamonas testosteroni]